jgi:hypothetical protein
MKLTERKLRGIIREEISRLTESQLNQELEDLKFKFENELGVTVKPISRKSMEVRGRSGTVNILFEAYEFQMRGDRQLAMKLKDAAGQRYALEYYGTQ